jgi:S-disulfanyl-L-cysteine oxidoreductase SoxD
MCRFIDGNWTPAFAGVTAFAFAMTAFVAPAKAGVQFPGIGRPATPAEIRAWDIDVRPDFQGLPAGSGSVEQGGRIWDAKCASCHGTFGESNEVFTPLVGGTTAEDMRTGHVKSLTDPTVARTTFMKLSTISSLWDYVRRAMPWNAPKSLTVDEVYAVVAYLLNLADIVPNGFVLSNANIAEVQARLPNRNGMTREHGLWDVKGKPDTHNVACMKDCPVESGVASALPKEADGSHGDLTKQQRGNWTPASAGVTTGATPLDLARKSGCLACHGVDRRIVGPGFHDVAARYKGDAAAHDRLVEKLRTGGSGAWGSIAMPPQPGVKPADADALVRWILGGAL